MFANEYLSAVIRKNTVPWKGPMKVYKAAITPFI